MRTSLRLVVPAALCTAVLATVLAAGHALGEDAPKTQFVLKLEKGATLEFQQDHSLSMNMTTQGMPMRNSTETHRAWTTKVVAVDEAGGGTIEVQFGRVHGSASNPMGTVDFDSDVPAPAADPSNPMAAMIGGIGKAFTVLAGKTATAKVAKDGKIAEVTGLDGIADDAGRGQARSIAQANSSAPAVKTFLQGCFAKLPDKPVGVGDTWTDQITQDASGGVKLSVALTFALTAIDDATATVTVDGKITMEPPAAPAADGEKGGGAAPDAPDVPRGGRGTSNGTGGSGRGGRGGMGGMLRDTTLEKGEVKGTFKVSRKDGMALVYDSKSTLVFKGRDGTPQAGSSIEQSVTSHVVRKVAAATTPAPEPVTPPAPPAAK